MPFYYAFSDSSGNRITSSDTLLSPYPTTVEYPNVKAGQEFETTNGVVIVQQPSKDPRRRAWVWNSYPAWMLAYQTLWNQIYPLRARYRTLYGAATPYIYLKDTETGLLRRQVTVTGTTASSTGTTLTASGSPGWATNAYAGMQVEVVSGTGQGQVRTIQSNTASQLTVTQAWGTNPVSPAPFVIRGWVDDWFKVRVLDVQRKTREQGGLVVYENTRVDFVVEDATWNYLG